jgi:hypothetical protein
MERKIESGGRRIRRWTGAAALTATLLAASVMGVAVAGAASESPGALPGEPNVPWDDGAFAAQARPDLVNVAPRTWDHVLFAPDGRTAVVYFWMRSDACEGLAGIETTPTDTGYRILVMTGDVPGAEACADVVQLYRSVVVLDERVVTGGEVFDLPSGSVDIAG